jgi:hypothetical protein
LDHAVANQTVACDLPDLWLVYAGAKNKVAIGVTTVKSAQIGQKDQRYAYLERYSSYPECFECAALKHLVKNVTFLEISFDRNCVALAPMPTHQGLGNDIPIWQCIRKNDFCPAGLHRKVHAVQQVVET